ncbi:hypothetical protein PU629_02190 [Pullulanibacillus sp. KACC 23026]|nr:hypothetical protein [Pullulanibacillus sp. KACC 23026]WEG13195.1 hypothetical protein PU629_02190 [Pullulanibacillus sp. KACC 23026]
MLVSSGRANLQEDLGQIVAVYLSEVLGNTAIDSQSSADSSLKAVY